MPSPNQFSSNCLCRAPYRWFAQGLVLSVCAAAGLALGGCLVAPVPMTNRVAGVSGSPEQKKIDLKFVEPGKTPRSEVVQKLAWADAGIKDPHLFLGRWFTSGGGWIWAVSVKGDAAEGGTHRNWAAHNYLVEFDDAGVAKAAREIATHELVPSLQQWVAQAKADITDPAASAELTVSLQHIRTAQVVLSADSFELKDPSKKPRSFRIQRSSVASIGSAADLKVKRERAPELIAATIFFREATPMGKQMTIFVSAEDLLTLLKYTRADHRSPQTQ